METITFKMQFTFAKQSVVAFAKFLGYKSTVFVEVNDETTADLQIKPTVEKTNPESAFDYVARLAKEHNEQFVTKWADFLVQKELDKQVEAIKPQIEQAIVKPVKDAIQVSYE